MDFPTVENEKSREIYLIGCKHGIFKCIFFNTADCQVDQISYTMVKFFLPEWDNYLIILWFCFINDLL